MMSVDTATSGTSARRRAICAEVGLHRVAAAHRAEDPVGARLDREVEELADRAALRHGPEQLLVGVEGVTRREPDAVDGGLSVDRPQEGGKVDQPGRVRAIGGDAVRVGARLELEERAPAAGPDPAGPVGEALPVGVHVLAQQGHLAVAGARELLDLVEDLVDRARHLLAPRRRHDAVGALLVAAFHDRHERDDPARRGSPSPAGGRAAAPCGRWPGPGRRRRAPLADAARRRRPGDPAGRRSPPAPRRGRPGGAGGRPLPAAPWPCSRGCRGRGRGARA